MDQETKNKIEELDKKINAIYESVEKTRKDYYVDRYHYNSSHCIPLIAMMFVIPSFIGNYTDTINMMGI